MLSRIAAACGAMRGHEVEHALARCHSGPPQDVASVAGGLVPPREVAQKGRTVVALKAFSRVGLAGHAGVVTGTGRPR